MSKQRTINGGLQGKIQQKHIGAYTDHKDIWSFVLTIGLNGHRVSVSKASYFVTPDDPTTSYINERTALHQIKTTAISLNVEILNLDEFEPRCYSCTSHVLMEETPNEFVCLTCGEHGPRRWFFTGGITNE